MNKIFSHPLNTLPLISLKKTIHEKKRPQFEEILINSVDAFFVGLYTFTLLNQVVLTWFKS